MSSNSTAALRLVLGDQLTPSLSSLSDIDADRDVILMAEVMDECTYVPHHPKKIAFILSAMRHFAEELEEAGYRVDYVKLDDEKNGGSFKSEVTRALKTHDLKKLIVTEPGEWRLLDEMRAWRDDLDADVEIRTDNRFLVSREDFADWATGRKTIRMEEFYRQIRKKTGLLMDEDNNPIGGKWNFDKENRKSIPDDVELPTPYQSSPDDITCDVIDLVKDRFGENFGDLEPFWFAVKSSEAKRAFSKFVRVALPQFGDFQDAMKTGEPTMFHSVVSMYLNAGLLDPLEMCQKVEAAYHDGDAPLNAVEGFIRQIIGWREYIRGIYWHFMPDYADRNTFDADRDLPDVYWGGNTDMVCMREAVGQTEKEAYAHHIQRLMVTGNFALLTGLDPKQVQDWYLAVYADAYEWVELPNTHGMALFADDGIMATKPYAAGGRYIDKMSNYCKSCRYDPTDPVGEDACPFSYLYWDFLIRNRNKLKGNHRLRTIYSTLDRMKPERIDQMRKNAKEFLDAL